MEITEINQTILEVSYKNKLSHLSSCLTAAPIIKEIYEKKRQDEKFVCSSGHAGLALYAVIERSIRDHSPSDEKPYTTVKSSPTAHGIFTHHGIHPGRCSTCQLDCSTGSLGQGLPVAVGFALARRDRNTYCLISDGETAEGSVWEALRIKTELGLDNLKVYANLNGYSAYHDLDSVTLAHQLETFDPKIHIVFTSNPDLPWLAGVSGHYVVMDEEKYMEALQLLT